MVRVGEYSPNFHGNSPFVPSPSRGIFGFGEYEEKRKYYNEQRKLEYKQFLAQKALNSNSPSNRENDSCVSTENACVYESCIQADTARTLFRREVATQTINTEQRDVSTNTNPDGGLAGNLGKHSSDGFDSLVKGEDFRDLVAVRPAHEQERSGNIGPKNGLTKQLPIRERHEEWLRNRSAEEGSRELERHGVEKNHTKALEDCRQQRLKQSLKIQEELQREAKESRRMKKMNQREMTLNVVMGAELDGSGECFSSEKGFPLETSKCVPKGRVIPSHKSTSLKLSRPQSEAQERLFKHDSIRPEVLNVSLVDGVSPGLITEDFPSASTTSAKDSSNSSILSQLGELRRQLAAQQMKMEEALKKKKSFDKEL